jgi:membrane protease YdiL (CAAX protease family)
VSAGAAARGRCSPLTAVGVLVAMGGPPLLATLGRHRSPGIAAATYAALVIAVVAIAHHEGLPAARLGLRRPDRATLPTAAALAIVYIYAITPLMTWALARLGGAGFEPGLRELRALPAAWLTALIVVGVAVEELFYRGYAFERLVACTRSTLAGGLISSVAFGLAHAPLWGLEVGVVLILPAVTATAVYAWRRDLLALVLAHVVTDLLGVR